MAAKIRAYGKQFEDVLISRERDNHLFDFLFSERVGEQGSFYVYLKSLFV